MKPRLTVHDFDVWVRQPENSEKRCELIGGKVVEAPSNPFMSRIAGWILTAINVFLLADIFPQPRA